jgi:thioredoxin 1
MKLSRILASVVFLTAFASAQQQQLVLNPKLYDPAVNAKKEIAEKLSEAAKDHKRVILVFGGNWCFDCHVLDYRFHEDGIKEIVDANYHVVHVDIGKYDKNLDLPEKYGTTIKKGVPALAVLSPEGKVLFGDVSGEFENARTMDPKAIVTFLEKWKPEKK